MSHETIITKIFNYLIIIFSEIELNFFLCLI